MKSLLQKAISEYTDLGIDQPGSIHTSSCQVPGAGKSRRVCGIHALPSHPKPAATNCGVQFIYGTLDCKAEADKFIEGSVEPSGLQLYAKMPQKEWDEWLQLFKDRLTVVLGYSIGEPEDGYEFQYWE